MTTLCEQPALALLPPRRLGALLGEARRHAGWTVAEVTLALRGRLDDVGLLAVEAGARFVDDELVRLLAALYGVTLEAIVPQRARLVVDPEEAILMVGPRRVALGASAPPHEVLVRYLALIYALRGIKPGRFFVPRADDLDVLGTYLERRADDVRLELEDLMAGARDEVGRVWGALRLRAVVPGSGLLVGVSDGGALLLVGGPDERPTARTARVDAEWAGQLATGPLAVTVS